MTSTLLGIAFAASLAHAQVLPLTSAPSSALQSGAPTSAHLSMPNRTLDMNSMLAALNAHRAAKGLAALALDSSLTAIAYEHAADMVSRKYFDHNTPEGVTPFARMDKANYQYGYAGENIALDQSSKAAELALWQSSEHRDNILGSHYAKVGIAVVAGTDGDYVVEDFSD